MTGSPIDFFFDPISPYGYLASTQIEALAARHGRAVDWRPVLLSVTVLQIMGLKPVPLTPLKGEYSRDDKHRLASLLGVPLVEHGLGGAVSPIKSLRLFMALKSRDPALAARYAQRLCTAHWAESQDIGDVGVLLRVAESVGVAAAEVHDALHDEAVKDALRTAVDDAVALGVFGVPTFRVDDQLIWGVDRLWMLEHWLEAGAWTPPLAGASRRSGLTANALPCPGLPDSKDG
jgi:2-hydroxychromene-2-carboxylate isomerase